MIYMVDHIYADPATEPAWHAWYSGYLHKLVSVPGLDTAQRFKVIGHIPSRYLAMYSIESADVFTSAGYKAIGGGGSQSVRFQGAYQLWTRNLFDVLPRADGTPAPAVGAPAVGGQQCIVVFDRNELPGESAPGALAARTTWLQSVGLHKNTKYRGFIVLDVKDAASARDIPGSRVYAPFTAVIRKGE